MYYLDLMLNKFYSSIIPNHLFNLYKLRSNSGWHRLWLGYNK